MAATRSEARAELLRRLLEKYERSSLYGQPAPWPHDLIVRLDEKGFPDAFGPEGREALAALHAAAEELASARAVRVVRAGGWSDQEPREVRLGPAELGPALVLARADGFEPIELGITAVRDQARRLAGTGPPWMDAFLGRIDSSAGRRDFGPLGMQPERFKREWRELAQALTGAVRVAAGVAGWERVVSEAIFGDSKRLGVLRTRVEDLLVRADPRWDGVGPGHEDVLESYGVRRKPGLLKCAGAADLRVGEGVYHLEDFVPVAHLPDLWTEAWVEGVARARPTTLTTIENEYPFLAYVEERGGPRVLGRDGELVVYLGGFPPPSLTRALADLAARLPGLALRHWGDADLGGLRIWRHLRDRLLEPVSLFRTDRAWLEGAARRGGKRLSPVERAGLARLRQELDRGARDPAPDVLGVLDLIDGLLALDLKVEQERF